MALVLPRRTNVLNAIPTLTVPTTDNSNGLKVDKAGNLNLGPLFSIISSTGNMKTGSINVKGTITTSDTISINNSIIILDKTGLITAQKVNLNTTLKIGNAITLNNDGTITTTLNTNTYKPSDASSNIATTSVSGVQPNFGASTANYLTTQDYVDREIWKQTRRINTIIGTDELISENFYNIYIYQIFVYLFVYFFFYCAYFYKNYEILAQMYYQYGFD